MKTTVVRAENIIEELAEKADDMNNKRSLLDINDEINEEPVPVRTPIKKLFKDIIATNQNKDKYMEAFNSLNTTINIVILGDHKSGKSSLIDCYLNQTFDSNSYTEHLIRIKSKEFSIGGINFDICFLELSGNLLRDTELILEYINCAHCFLICHSLDKPFQEQKIEKWIELTENKAEVYLVGCKLDLKLFDQLANPKDLLNESNQQLKELEYDNVYDIIEGQHSNASEANNKLKEESTNKATNFDDFADFDTEEFMCFENQMRDFITNHGLIKYFYTSALLNYNIDSLFETVLRNYLIQFLSKLKDQKVNVDDKFTCGAF